MLIDMLSGGPRHPIQELREKAGITQAQLSKLTGLTCSRISLAENYLGKPLSESEEKKLRDAIVNITESRRSVVLREAGRHR